MKKIYHKRNVFTKIKVLKILGESECVTMFDTSLDFFNNLGSLQNSIYCKYPDGTISKGYLFIVTSNSLTSASMKSSAAADELVIHDLKLGGKKVLRLIHSAVPQFIKDILLDKRVQETSTDRADRESMHLSTRV